MGTVKDAEEMIGMVIGQERNGPLMGFYGPVHHPFRSHFPSGEGGQPEVPLFCVNPGDVDAPPVHPLQRGAGRVRLRCAIHPAGQTAPDSSPAPSGPAPRHSPGSRLGASADGKRDYKHVFS